MDDYYGSNEDFGGDSGGNWDYNYNPEEDNLAWNDVNSQYSPQAPQGGAPQYPMDQNISNVPAEGWNQTGTDWSQMGDYWNQTDNMGQQGMPNIGGIGGVDYSSGIDNSGLYAPASQLGTGGGDTGGIDYAKWGNKGLDLLGKVFGGAGNSAGGGAGGTNGLASVLKTLLAGGLTKKTNDTIAQQTPQMVNTFRQQASPFDAAPGVVDPNSMRGIAQSQYSQSMADPYGSKIVSDQVNQMKAAQARKDAAAGRRSNTAFSSPAMLAAAADAAMKYQNQLGQQSGAGQFMGQNGLDQLMTGMKAGAQGYSPYMAAAGMSDTANSYQNNPDYQAMLADYYKRKGTA